MSRSTRGSRPITVDVHHLHWHVGRGRSPHPGRGRWATRITVFSKAGATSRLVAEMDPESYRLLPIQDSGDRPRHAEVIVRHALAAGWDPASRGEDFLIADLVPIVVAAGAN